MNTQELAKIDLNLLISLQILLEEKSVSRAAKRLSITQPAMSKTLSRLRTVFGDPLFTRSSHGMQPTPRAQELGVGLEEILASINNLVSGSQFDPATTEDTVTIALSEYIGVSLLPTLTKRLSVLAPRLNIRIITRVENQLEQLAVGNLDLALHIRHPHYGPEFRVQELGGSPPVILSRIGHPLHQGELTWERLTQYPVIRLYISDWAQLQTEKLAKLAELYSGIARSSTGSLETSHLMTALEVLRTSDHYMLGPAYVLRNEGLSRDFASSPLPDDEDYSIDYALVAHERTNNSPLHNWLWREITCTIAELRSTLPRKLRERVSMTAATTTA